MKNRIIVTSIFCMQLTGCTNLKYPNWEYVRIENQVPDKSCIYKMQEACSLPTNQCMDWHKQRATKFNANTVVITNSENLKKFSSSAWTGKVSGGENSSTIADYYFCNGPKNINPS